MVLFKLKARTKEMHPMTTRCVTGWVIAAMFLSGMIIGNITSEQYSIYLLKPRFMNSSIRALTTLRADDRPSSATYSTFQVHSNCSNLTTPRVGPTEDMWQPLSRTNNRLFLYSAFLEGDTVSIVAITDLPGLKATCQLWYRHVANSTVYMLTSPTRMAKIPGGEQRKVKTKYIKCAVHHRWSPFAVSIVDGSDVCAPPSNVFQVYQPRSHNDTVFNFTICVPPVRGDYPSVQRLVEWIEMNRLLGVQFFTFYNESLHEGVEQIFRKYEKQGILEILPWNCPDVDVHYGAQVASMHDCLNRNQQRNTRFSSFLDLDEIIIPHKPDEFTWEDMLNKLPFACSYSFRSSFFPGNYTGADFRVFRANRSYVLNNLMRFEKIFRQQDRSKMIVRPNDVQFIGTHLTYACKRRQKPMFLEANVGLLHHYRHERGNATKIKDTTAMKYKSRLDERLRYVYSLFPEYSTIN